MSVDPHVLRSGDCTADFGGWIDVDAPTDTITALDGEA